MVGGWRTFVPASFIIPCCSLFVALVTQTDAFEDFIHPFGVVCWVERFRQFLLGVKTVNYFWIASEVVWSLLGYPWLSDPVEQGRSLLSASISFFSIKVNGTLAEDQTKCGDSCCAIVFWRLSRILNDVSETVEHAVPIKMVISGAMMRSADDDITRLFKNYVFISWNHVTWITRADLIAFSEPMSSILSSALLKILTTFGERLFPLHVDRFWRPQFQS